MIKILFAAIFAASFPVILFAGPRIKFSNVTYNYGEAVQNSSVQAVYTFTNTGDSVLTINNVRASCGCTAALSTKSELCPGESGSIKATLNTGKFKGNVTKTIFVETNDPDNTRITLLMSGVITEEITLNPAQLYFINAHRGEKIQKEFFISWQEGKKIKITGVIPTNPAIHLNYQAITNSGDTGYKFFVEIDTSGVTNSSFNERIIISTDNPNMPRIEQNIFGDILSSTNK